MPYRKNGIVMERFINPPLDQWEALTRRGSASYASLEPLAKEVFENVGLKGDQAIINYTQQFDQVLLEDFVVSAAEVKAAKAQVSQELKQAISKAKENIYQFHLAQQTPSVAVETQKGVKCWQKKTTHRKSRTLHTRGIGTLVFNHLDVGHSRTSSRMQKNCLVLSSR
jgi:histidinol dehydrogenase